MSSRRLWYAIGVLALLAIGGCEEGRRTLYFSQAPSSCSASPRLEIGCLIVRVCESERPTVCVDVVRAGGHGPEEVASPLVVAGNTAPFDVQALPGVLYDVSVEAYARDTDPDAGVEAIALGYASRVSFGDASTRVLLRPTSESSTCPPASTGTQLRRAFHQAVALSNGDALILGGVTTPNGEPVEINFHTPKIGLVPVESSVLVFDGHDESFYPVRVTGSPEDVQEVSRALFEARWIERTVDGLERIRLFGGVTRTSSLTFVATVNSSLPVEPLDEEIVPARVVDLLFDPRRQTLSVEPMSESVVVAVESAREALPTSALRSLRGLVGDSPLMAWSLEGVFGSAVPGFDEIGQRRGASLTRIGADRFLIYGGQRVAPAPTDPAGRDWDQEADRAMLVDDGGRLPIAVPAELAVSTLHTASPFGSDGLLFVGGLGLSGNLTSAPSASSIRLMRYSAGAETLTAQPIDGSDAYDVERIYHTATRFREADAPDDAIVVVGGSSATRSGTTAAQFQELADAFVVEGEAAAPRIRSLRPLRAARFGHASVLLRGGRLLVTGGMRRGDPTAGEQRTDLYVVDLPELLFVRTLPAARACSAPLDGGRAVRPDAGAPEAPDAGEPAVDADGVDAAM